MQIARVTAFGLIGLGALAGGAPAQVAVPPTSTSSLKAMPRTYGTANLVYVTVPEWQFSPASSAWGYADLGGPFGRYPLAPQAFFLASPTLPTGALLQNLEFDYCNQQPPGGQSVVLWLYDTTSDNGNVTELASITGTPGQGCTYAITDLSGLNYTVDNHRHRLMLQAVFGDNADSTVSINGAIFAYILQVNPAPGASTFSDVPVSDPAFQYVEALAASGITGGCGGGKFCPDNPVTRRQMAIFLSKALGLYFP